MHQVKWNSKINQMNNIRKCTTNSKESQNEFSHFENRKRRRWRRSMNGNVKDLLEQNKLLWPFVITRITRKLRLEICICIHFAFSVYGCAPPNIHTHIKWKLWKCNQVTATTTYTRDIENQNHHNPMILLQKYIINGRTWPKLMWCQECKKRFLHGRNNEGVEGKKKESKEKQRRRRFVGRSVCTRKNKWKGVKRWGAKN